MGLDPALNGLVPQSDDLEVLKTKTLYFCPFHIRLFPFSFG